MAFDVPADAATGHDDEHGQSPIPRRPTPTSRPAPRGPRSSHPQRRHHRHQDAPDRSGRRRPAGDVQLVVSNAGPSAAVDATITDALPAGTSFARAASAAAHHASRPTSTRCRPCHAWRRASPSAGTVTGTLTLATSADLVGPLGNTASPAPRRSTRTTPATRRSSRASCSPRRRRPPPPPRPRRPRHRSPSPRRRPRPGGTTTTTTTTTQPSAPPTTARRGSGGGGGGGGSLPATGIADRRAPRARRRLRAVRHQPAHRGRRPVPPPAASLASMACRSVHR